MDETRLKRLRSAFGGHIRFYFKEPFLCSIGCNEMVLPKLYEKHCKEIHHLDPLLKCVWCQGKVSWKKGEKYKHMDHIMQCVDNLLRPTPIIIQTEEEDEPLILFDSTPTCQIKCSFDHFFDKNLTYDLDPKYFLSESGSDTISEYFRLRRNTLEFEIEEINLARKYVELYLLYPTEVTFVHIMIRRPAFKSFLSRMENDPHSKLLEFYCWCDGGDFPDPLLRQHIHLILVTSDYIFFKDNVWNDLTADRSFFPPAHYKCKFSKDVQSAYHLVNIIGYLSNRKSKCNFHSQKSKEDKLNHFYINKALPKDFKYCLVTQWNGGLKEFVEGKHRNYCPKFGQEGLSQDNRGRWKIPYKYLPYIHRNLILPIRENFLPTEEESTACIYLTKERTMFFEEYDKNVEFSPFQQASKGNVFIKAIETDVFYPGSKCQKILNAIATSLHIEKEKHRAEMETIKQTQKSEFERIIANQNEKNMELEKFIAKQNEKDMELEKFIANQNEKYMELEKFIAKQNEKIMELEKIITSLKQNEIESLKKRNSEMLKGICLRQIENESLKKRNSELENITVFNKNEITSLKKENKKLKRIIKHFNIQHYQPNLY